MPSTRGARTHLFTVDVEEAFHVGAFERYVDRDEWPGLESRVEGSVDTLLECLSAHGAHATFFTLGWVAERHPDMVRRIAQEGHEVASHGWWHRRVTRLTAADFREEVRTSKALLEDLTGEPVHGFRAPNFSVIPGTEWAFDVLLEEGYAYDSSLFPITRPGYGYPNAPRDAFLVRRPSGTLLEVPIAIRRFWGVRVPASGGAYFRLFPYALARATLRQYSGRGRPGCFYIHPWEVDPGQPRLDVDLLTRIRHYSGLRRTLPRIERLLSEFSFTSIARAFGLARERQIDGLAVVALPA